MFERFTESARRALFFARAEVTWLGGATIETDHLLLGLLRTSGGVTSQICAEAGVTYERAKKDAQTRASLPRVDTNVEIPFSSDAKHVLERAAEEAGRLLHSYIGTEHLLLGLLHGAGHPAAVLLAAHGMELGAVRDDVVHRLNQLGASSPPGVDHLPGAVSCTASDDELAQRFARLRRLLGQVPNLVAASPAVLTILHEIRMELDELERRPL